MTLLTKRALIGISTPNPSPNHRLAGWIAGEALGAGDACTLHTNGRIYRASGAAADANARIFGYAADPCSAGEACTLYDHVTLEYGSGLTPGTLFYLSGTTPGGLDTDPSPGGTIPCAVALDSTRVHVVSTWGGGAGGGGGADPLVVHPWSGTYPIVDETGSPRLIVGAEVTDTGGGAYATAVFGNNDPATTPTGLAAYSGQSTGVYGRSHLSYGVDGWSDGYHGVHGYSDSTYAGVAGESTSGPAIQATGYLAMTDHAEPPTPPSGIVIWSDTGVLKWKGPDGVVH
jgi:hypothetical protein